LSPFSALKRAKFFDAWVTVKRDFLKFGENPETHMGENCIQFFGEIFLLP
jgi:hypothetical protein